MIIYNEELKERVENLKKQTELEKLILDLEKDLNKDPEALEKLEALKVAIKDLEKQLPNDSHKKYLAEIILEEKPEFKSNNLILSPVGSGKSTLIKEVLIDPNNKNKAIILVSTRFLKDAILESDISSDSPLNIKTLKKLKDGDDSVLIMTYHEFGLKIKDSNKFVENINQIFCDEIHSLPEYKEYGDSGNVGLVKFGLEHSMKYLFNKQPGKQIFYFTATDESFNLLKETRPELVEAVEVFDYRNHPDIKRYMELAKSYITHIEQIRPFLKDRKESFEYFRSKGVAFGKTIRNLKVIEGILKEEGYNPLVLWSDSNTQEKLTKEQLRARKELLTTNLIPEKYDFLVMNSALREGWDLKDPSVRIAIMNTTNETDTIQARGRIRKDIDLIIYKSTEDFDKFYDKEVMDKYLNKPLTAQDKENLCEILNVRDKYNRPLKWRTVNRMLKENGYNVKESKITIDGKRTLVSIISVKEN